MCSGERLITGLQSLLFTLLIVTTLSWGSHGVAQESAAPEDPAVSGSTSTSASEPARPKVPTDAQFAKLFPVFSGVASLKEGDAERFTRIEGYADVDAKIKHTRATRFPICSLSKQFASVAILRLVDQGKVNLSAPLHTYISGLDPIEAEGKVCTVQDTMNHLCGLPRSMDISDPGDTDRPEQQRAYIEAINATPRPLPPRTKRLYSNVGYNALGLIVQRVSGRNLEGFLRDELFTPLGMKNTGIQMPLPVTAPQRARGMAWLKWVNLDAATAFNIPANASSTIGVAGNIYSTVDDLHVWNRALHTGAILTPASYAALTRVPKVNHRSESGPPSKQGGYAGGIVALEYEGGDRILWHNGALVPHGFSTFMAWSPRDQISFVVLSNHAPYVSELTEGGLNLIEWVLGVRSDTPPTELSWQAYIFLMIALFVLIGFPWMLYGHIKLMMRGHRKGATKALSSLISYSLYTPIFLFFIWEDETLRLLIFSLYLIMTLVALPRALHHFRRGLKEASIGQLASLSAYHLLTLVLVSMLDSNMGWLLGGGLVIILAVYSWLDRRSAES